MEFHRLRRASTVLVCAYTAAWAPALAVWLFDLPLAVGSALLAVALLVGGYVGYRRPLEPMETQERRDAVAGWSFVLVLFGAIVAFVLPLPWSVVVAVAWLGLVTLTARLLLAQAPRPPSPRASRPQRESRKLPVSRS